MSSWGRLSADPHQVVALQDRGSVAQVLAAQLPGIAHGSGRSYGDVCLNPGGVLWNTTGLDRLIGFDGSTGRLVCEAGVLLRDIQRLMVPRGWMLPVTPGTQLVTVGGAVANDVHGKNHHVRGSFCDHVQWLKLARSDGEIIECGPRLRPEWFAATAGGVGLTGVIVEVDIQLCRVAGPWLGTQTLAYTGLEEFFGLADGSEEAWEHTVSWIDCTPGKRGRGGRGLFMRARAAQAGAGERREAPRRRSFTLPWVPPFSLVGGRSLQLFNAAYFHFGKWRAGDSVTHYERFFYPLDGLREWNRIYGPQGFYQHQSVVPRERGLDAVQAMLDLIAASGEGSFLAVLKTFGDRQPVGMMSFPRPGVTLALDFSNRGDGTLRLLERLDGIVREAGGRLYLAKDARMPRDLFEAGYPRLNEFLRYRDPGISSGLSRRLMGS